MPPNPEGSLLTQDTARTQPGPSQSKQFFANHSLESRLHLYLQITSYLIGPGLFPDHQLVQVSCYVMSPRDLPTTAESWHHQRQADLTQVYTCSPTMMMQYGTHHLGSLM